MSRLVKRGKVWHVWVYEYRDGRRVRRSRSTGCTDKRAAEVQARAIEHRAAEGRLSENVAAHSVRAALEALVERGCQGRAPKTIEMYRSRSGHLLRLLGHKDVRDVALEDVQRFIDVRLSENAHSHTVYKELVTLRRALKLARAEGYLRTSPADVFPAFSPGYEPRDRWLTTEEFGKVWAKLKPHRRLWLTVAVFTGCRLSEVEGIRWEHVDFERGWIEIHGTKTEGAERGIPLAAQLRTLLQPLKQKSGPVVRPWGKAARDIKTACARANCVCNKRQGCKCDPKTKAIPPATPNDLRRTMASWMVQAGVPERAIADLLGHERTTMVRKVYAKMSDPALRQAMLAMPCFNSASAESSVTGSVPATSAEPRSEKPRGSA